jgi:hypothetical protein
MELQHPGNRIYEQRWYPCCECDSSGVYRLYPEPMTAEYNGKRYCREHFLWRWTQYFRDQVKIEITGEKP